MMKLSCQSQLRKYYIDHGIVPSFSDVREQLGTELAQVFMEECPESLKDEMGLSDMLRGPGQTLWTSPSDLLIGKVALTPPLTMKHVRALTHEGILNLGAILEAQWLAQLKYEKQLALKNLEELMMLTAEKDKQRAVAIVLDECQRKYQTVIEQFKHDFEAIMAPELSKLEEALREYYEQVMAEKVNELIAIEEAERNKQIADAVEESVQKMTRKFMMEQEKQEEELISIFQARIEGQAERFKAEIGDQQTVFGMVMKHLKHSMQCHNIASLVYVLCLERKKCFAEQQAILDALNAQVAQLERSQMLAEKKLVKLQCELDIKRKQLQVRHECLLGVIAQFQKFINYALRAVPTQAEFLLSVEKILAFELTQTPDQTSESRHLTKKIMSWNQVLEQPTYKPGDLFMNAYHDCLNQTEKPKEKSPSEEDLVTVTYQKKLYVREDFRDRMARGLCQPRDSKLWNKDVENFIKLLAEQECQPTPASSQGSLNVSSVHFIETENRNPTGLLGIRDSLAMSKLNTTQNLENEPGEHTDYDEYDLDLDEAQMKRKITGVSLLAVVDSVTILKDKIKSSSKLVLPKSATRQPRKPAHTLSDTTLQLKKSSRGSKQSYITAPMEAPEINAPMDTLEIMPSEKGRRSKRSSSQLKTPILKAAHKHKVSSTDVSDKRGRDSEQAGSYPISPSPTPSCRASITRKTNLSKLSHHRDSLEVIGMHFDPLKRKLKDIITPAVELDPDYPMTKYAINVPAFPVKGVGFERMVEVFNECSLPEKPWMIYQESEPSATINTGSEQSPDFMTTPNVANIVGDPTVEDNKTIEDFTIHRMRSLVELLKTDDSLIRMFTRGGQ